MIEVAFWLAIAAMMMLIPVVNPNPVWPETYGDDELP